MCVYTALGKIKRPLQNDQFLWFYSLLVCVTLPLGDFMPLLAQTFKQLGLCLMACDHPSSTWSHSRGFQWDSGLEIGLAMAGSWPGGPSSTPSLTWLCSMEHCPAGKNTPQSWGSLSEQREASFLPGQAIKQSRAAWIFAPGVVTQRQCERLVDSMPRRHFSANKCSKWQYLYLKFGRNVVSSL